MIIQYLTFVAVLRIPDRMRDGEISPGAWFRKMLKKRRRAETSSCQTSTQVA